MYIKVEKQAWVDEMLFLVLSFTSFQPLKSIFLLFLDQSYVFEEIRA